MDQLGFTVFGNPVKIIYDGFGSGCHGSGSFHGATS